MMLKKFIPLSLVLALCLTLPVNATYNIIWVSEETDLDGNGIMDDQGWVDLLTSQGYSVDVQRNNWQTLDDAKIDTLNSADLIIISRSTNSENYIEGAEAEQWNSITAPIISSNTQLTTSSDWGWIDSTTLLDDIDSPLLGIYDGVPPIFSNVQVAVLDETVGSGNTTFIDTTDVGNGTLIATAVGYDAAWIAEWQSGSEFYDGAGQYAGGRRMLFTAGTQEGTGTPQGAYNLTPEGERVFLNAVTYMIPEPATIVLLGLGGLILLQRRKIMP